MIIKNFLDRKFIVFKDGGFPAGTIFIWISADVPTVDV
jgi:hypothetical protein